MRLRVAVDGSGLERPHAGIGRYTEQILAAMRTERPQNRLTVLEPLPAGEPVAVPVDGRS